MKNTNCVSFHLNLFIKEPDFSDGCSQEENFRVGLEYVCYSPLGSSVQGVSQARIAGCVAIFFSRGSSQLRDRTQVSCIAGEFFTS